MKKLLSAAACIALCGGFASAASAVLSYPAAPRSAVTDTYFGTKVADPYRWMEQIDSPQTQTWLKAEIGVTQQYFAAIPQRGTIEAHLRKIANYEKVGAPYHIGNRYFLTYNSGLQNQSVLYTMTSLHAKRRVLIDPNALSKDGTVALGPTAISPDAKYIAYATQTAGSDWETWHVRNIATGQDLSDKIEWSKFSDAAWRNDDSGFYYERYDAPSAGETYKSALYGQKLFFHKLGTPQSADSLVYTDPAHKDYFFAASVTEDGRYLIMTQSSGSSDATRIYYRDLKAAGSSFVPLFDKGDAQWSFVDNDGPVFYVQTDKDAPNFKVVAVDTRNPQAVRTFIPQSSSAMQGVSTVGHNFFPLYLKDAHSQVVQYDRHGKRVRDVRLPGIGTVSGFGGLSRDTTTFYTYGGYTSPPVIYQMNVASGVSTVLRKTKVAFDDAQFVTDEVFYTSKDGTRVPLMVAHRRGLKLNGQNPTILYGYGGFDIPITPNFSSMIASWLQMGGVYAVANIRGGSEYGESWHHGGWRNNKQHVFDDFISAAEFLIAKQYTSTPKLAIKGESNGGLLIGAVEIQRPDLFGAALPGVGVMDMLRFQDFTIGNAWISEYGCSTCTAEQFKTLYAYSPVHNIKPGTKYPPTLISTADHDDRVFPAHSFKFAATMQAAQAGDAPVLLRVDVRAGHGGGKPITKVIEDYADSYAFLLKNLGLTLPAGY